MTTRRKSRSYAVLIALVTTVSFAPFHGAHAQAAIPQDPSGEQQGVADRQQADAPIVPLGRTAIIAGSQEGQRLSGREAGVLRSPSARVSNRIRNRIDNRLRTRIDADYAAPTDNLNQFSRAADAAADEFSAQEDGEPDGR